MVKKVVRKEIYACPEEAIISGNEQMEDGREDIRRYLQMVRKSIGRFMEGPMVK